MGSAPRATDALARGLDLAFDDSQQAIADALGAFCAERCGEEVVKACAGRFLAELWRELAGLGVLGLATPEGEGGACELVAVLGAAHVCHQLFGASGIALEGPVFHVTRRIRQLVSQAPSADRARDALLCSYEL